MSRQIGKRNFKKEVLEGSKLTLVHFEKRWNGASQLVETVCNELSVFYKGIVNFYTIDIEKEAAISKELGVFETPVILFFRNGKMIDHAMGLTPKYALIEKIEAAIKTPDNA